MRAVTQTAPTLLQWLRQTPAARQYLTTSPVVLGVGRILLALLLLFDVLRRWQDLDVWYTNAGLMPNHTMLWAPQARLGFSIFYSVSELHEARLAVLLIVAVYVLLLVGYRTRLMQVLALLAQVSLNCRIHYLTNGGDNALSALLLWTAFLPLGSWLSVDALLLKLRHSRLQVGADGVASLVVDPQRPELFDKPAPRLEWAMGGLVAQLAVIYFFNFIHKDGSGWREGRVLLDVLHQDRIATGLAVWLRQHLTYGMSFLGTRATQVVEAALPALLLLPVRSTWVRRVAVGVGMSLHLGFEAFLNLGVFSATMVMMWFFLVPPQDLERVVGWLGGKRREGTLYFDSDCGVCSLLARALLCMQATGVGAPRFVVKSNAVAPGEVEGVTPEQLHEAVLWRDTAGNRWGAHAFTAVASTFALSRPLAWVFQLGVTGRAYRAFAARRHVVSGFLGLGACGLARTVEPFAVEPPARAALRRLGGRVRLVLLSFIAVVFVVQVLAQNRAVPAALKPDPPFWVVWPVEYLHFFQGWGMFAESPRGDSTVVVRATTVDGRLVDPLSERASPRSPPGLRAITDRLGHDEFWCDYLSRITGDRAYEAPLRDWILAYPRRTGRAEDTIARFEVVQLTDTSPWYGQAESTDRQERAWLTWP